MFGIAQAGSGAHNSQFVREFGLDLGRFQKLTIYQMKMIAERMYNAGFANQIAVQADQFENKPVESGRWAHEVDLGTV